MVKNVKGSGAAPICFSTFEKRPEMMLGEKLKDAITSPPPGLEIVHRSFTNANRSLFLMINANDVPKNVND